MSRYYTYIINLTYDNIIDSYWNNGKGVYEFLKYKYSSILSGLTYDEFSKKIPSNRNFATIGDDNDQLIIITHNNHNTRKDPNKLILISDAYKTKRMRKDIIGKLLLND